MDTGNNDNLEYGKLGNMKNNVTPHKIAVVAFIREFGLLKIEAKSLVCDYDCVMAPKYRKDFCMLALKLIQCPDMEFKELESLLTNGRYNLLSFHLQNFCQCLQNIYANGISALVDCVTSTIDKLMIEQSETNPCMITRTSILGFYLRRIMLQLDKLTFVQLVTLYKSFCLYYQKGRPGLMIRSISKDKLNNMEVQGAESTTPPTAPEESKHELSMKMSFIDRDHFEERHWSRRQAELFTAQQANLLQINEQKALPPRDLQKGIIEIVNDIPVYPDIHFLSFLNCLRMKEFCGAQDSLYNCFDRSLFNIPGSGGAGDKNKHFRYAALNRAAMHTQFGHKEMALEGVTEALIQAQQAGDAACLAHVTAWAARAGAAPPAAAPARAAPAAAAQHARAQRRAAAAHPPAQVFAAVTKGDSINLLHSMTDLTLASLCNTAAMWALYGKTEMASVYCQLLLNLNTKSTVSPAGVAAAGGVWYWTEASAAAAAGAAAAAAARGAAGLGAALLARHRHPLLRAAVLHADAEAALRAGKWEEADQLISQLASYNRWESQLLKAEMYFLKGDPTSALAALHDVLDHCRCEDDSLHYVALRLRAMLLQSQVQQSFGGMSSVNNSNIVLLNEVLLTARRYHLHYLAATAELHVARVQLALGCTRRALALVRRVLPAVCAHAGAYDMGRALLLYAKCRVAAAPGGAGAAGGGAGAAGSAGAAGGAGAAAEVRAQVLSSCCGILDTVKKHFAKVGAHSRLLETWYFQAQLYNEIGNVSARNQCAWSFRQLEAQNPVDNTHSMLMLY